MGLEMEFTVFSQDTTAYVSKTLQSSGQRDAEAETETFLLGCGTESAICITWHGGSWLRWDLYFIADGFIKFNSLQSL